MNLEGLVSPFRPFRTCLGQPDQPYRDHLPESTQVPSLSAGTSASRDQRPHPGREPSRLHHYQWIPHVPAASSLSALTSRSPAAQRTLRLPQLAVKLGLCDARHTSVLPSRQGVPGPVSQEPDGFSAPAPRARISRRRGRLRRSSYPDAR